MVSAAVVFEELEVRVSIIVTARSNSRNRDKDRMMNGRLGDPGSGDPGSEDSESGWRISGRWPAATPNAGVHIAQSAFTRR